MTNFISKMRYFTVVICHLFVCYVLRSCLSVVCLYYSAVAVFILFANYLLAIF